MKNVVLFLCLVMSTVVQAYDGWSGDYKIQSIRVYSSSEVLITMPGAANPKGCDDTTYIALLNADTEFGKRQYSALLSAYMADKNVSLAFTGCTSGGTSGWRIIEQVWLK